MGREGQTAPMGQRPSGRAGGTALGTHRIRLVRDELIEPR